MKIYGKILVIAAALLGGLTTLSAQMRTSYFMEGSYFRTDMNAALAPTRGYIKIPLAGGLGVNLGNNYLSVNNFFYQRNNKLYTFLYSGVSAEDFLGKLGNKGKLSLNLDVPIIGFGAHTKKFFWSVGINLRSQSEITLSKDMFAVLKNLSNGYYDLGDTNISNREYIDISLGAAIPIKKFVTVGFRVKGLVGLADLSMSMDKMYLDINEDIVQAEFLGGIRGNCPIFNSNYRAGSAFSVEDMMQRDISGIMNGVKSWGLGAELGVEVRLLDDHLKVSLGVNDLGFIRWSKSATINAEGKAHFSYEGFNLTSGKADVDGGFEAKMTPSVGSYTTRLSASLNAGVEYNILKNWIAFGLLSHTEFCQNFTRSELTASVNFRIMRWLSTSFSHTFFNGNHPGVLGWALNIHPTGLNIFLGADFIDTRFAVYNQTMLVPKMMTSANVYVGVGFNLGKAKYMKSMQKSKSQKDKKEKKEKKTKKA